MALPDLTQFKILLTQFKILDLEHTRFTGMPEMAGHNPVYGYEIAHRHKDTDRAKQGTRTSAWGNYSGNEHSGTHMDALCHQAESGFMHGSVPVNEETETKRGFTVNGAENLPVILAPGILLDIAALKGVESLEPHYRVTTDDIEACCGKDELTINPGSVVLVNLGSHRFWHDRERFLDCPGVSASASRMIADMNVLAVGADNFGWDEPTEYDRELDCNGPGHVLLLVRAGIYIFENLNLEHLVSSGHKEFIFFASPLKIKGGTGSPVRPLALIPNP